MEDTPSVEAISFPIQPPVSEKTSFEMSCDFVSENWKFISNILVPLKEYNLSSFKPIRGIISEEYAFHSIFSKPLLKLLIVISIFCFYLE